MDDCRSCKKWRDCKHDLSGFDYGDIRWCPYQIVWILQNAASLDAGIYPEQYKGHSRQLRAEGYFAKAKLVIGELRYRLELTDNHGELLITQVEDGRTLSTLSPGAYEILMYVKGWRRKSMDFHAWQRQRRYHTKVAQNRDKNEMKSTSI